MGYRIGWLRLLSYIAQVQLPRDGFDHINHQSRKSPHRLVTGQSDGSDSSTKIHSSLVTPVCFKLTKPNQHTIYKMIRKILVSQEAKDAHPRSQRGCWSLSGRLLFCCSLFQHGPNYFPSVTKHPMEDRFFFLPVNKS